MGKGKINKKSHQNKENDKENSCTVSDSKRKGKKHGSNEKKSTNHTPSEVNLIL